MLRKNGFSAEQVRALVRDYHHAGLDPVDVDVMDMAYQISRDDPSQAGQMIPKLREDGLSDEEILDIVLAAAVRNFFSRVLETLNTTPDLIYRGQDPELWALVMSLPNTLQVP